MKNCNFEEIEDNDTIYYRLIKIGEFRTSSCRTTHDNDKIVVQFCHPFEIKKEMQRFCKEVRKILKMEIDPFIKASWIQWSYSLIHSYADGNGRIGRILASIPLVKIGLPPIIVTIDQKEEYFKCLQDCEENLNNLSDFFIKTYYQGFTVLKNMVDENTVITSPKLRRYKR